MTGVYNYVFFLRISILYNKSILLIAANDNEKYPKYNANKAEM